MTENHDHLKALLDLVAQIGSGTDDELTEMLGLANRTLGTSIGIISHISADRYTVTHVDAPEDTLTAGATFELGQTYCAMTVSADQIVSIEHMANSPYAGHPCYESFGLETYIGTPILVHGTPHGTVNFSSAQPRHEPWTSAERMLVDLIARFVQKSLEQQDSEEEIKALAAEIERVNLELKKFISKLSHDFRAPLRNIRQLSEWVIQDESDVLSEDGLESMNLINQRASFAESMVQGLLSYARAGAKLPAEQLKIGRIVEDVKLLFDRDLAIEWSAPEADVTLPRVAFQDAIVQLLGFAATHHESWIKLTITVSEGVVTSTIELDGDAIPAHHIQPLFETFHSSDATAAMIYTTIAKQRARAHGGDITLAQNTPGALSLVMTWPTSS